MYSNILFFFVFVSLFLLSSSSSFSSSSKTFIHILIITTVLKTELKKAHIRLIKLAKTESRAMPETPDYEALLSAQTNTTMVQASSHLAALLRLISHCIDVHANLIKFGRNLVKRNSSSLMVRKR